MKRSIAALLILILLPAWAAAQGVEKYEALPPIFEVSVEVADRMVDDGAVYVYKEYVTTANPQVNAELRALVDGYEDAILPAMERDTRKKGKRGSVLNIATVYYRTGEKYLSTLTIARTSMRDEQLDTQFTTRTWDLETGERIMLTDLFDRDSPAWSLLAQSVRAHLSTIFPGEARDTGAIAALCTRESLQQAEFTLSGMELTLHYPANAVLDGKVTLTHVRLFYPQLSGMLTPLGVAATDNSRWKFVAVTCDDGPKDYNSSYALDEFRKVGARVTYFIAGKQLDRYGYVLQKQHDQNQIFGTHTFHHWSGYSFKTVKGRFKELTLSAELTNALVGEEAQLFRAPGGTYPPWVEVGMPMPIIQWSADTHDYTGKKPKLIARFFRDNVKEGDIVLCHDTGKYLFESVAQWGQEMTRRGFMFVTVDELAAATGVTLQPNVVYWSMREGENSIDREK